MKERIVRFSKIIDTDDAIAKEGNEIGTVTFHMYLDPEDQRFFALSHSHIKYSTDMLHQETIAIYNEIIKEATREIDYALSEDFSEDLLEILEAENENQTVQ